MLVACMYKPFINEQGVGPSRQCRPFVRNSHDRARALGYSKCHCGYYFCELLMASTYMEQYTMYLPLFRSRVGFLRGVYVRVEPQTIMSTSDTVLHTDAWPPVL